MTLRQTLVSALFLAPLMSFAASSAVVEWGVEPNGDLRVTTEQSVEYVSPENTAEYFDTLRMVRLGDSSVEATAAACSTATCSFNNVTRNKYACLLDDLYAMATSMGGVIESWPDNQADSGIAKFAVAGATFEIGVALDEPAQVMAGSIIQPSSASALMYRSMWGYVESSLAQCPS